jgi:hypothetical protein
MHFARSAAASLVFCALALSWSAPVRAEDGEPDDAKVTALNVAFAQRMFAGSVDKKKKTYACFTRVYDADHLAKHPLQKVSAMKLLVETENDLDTPYSYAFRLGLRYRNRSGDFDSSGACGRARLSDGSGDPRIGCSVDCDGGGVEVGLTADNKAAMLRVDHVRIWRGKDPDEEASYSLVGGADDRVFRLDRTSLSECASLVTERKELAALRSVANRKK